MATAQEKLGLASAAPKASAIASSRPLVGGPDRRSDGFGDASEAVLDAMVRPPPNP